MMKGLVAHDPKKGDAPEISPRFRLQPTTDASKREDQSAKELETYYIFKTHVDDMGRKHYLLAKDIQLIGDGRNVAHKLLGWLSDEYIQEWNQRLCLEPTYAKRSVEVYTNIGMYPAFFQMEAGAKRLCNLAEIVQPTWKYQKEFSTTRMKAQKMRIPLLEATANSDIFTSVYYAHRVNSNDHEDEIEQLRAMKEHVNIIFVVDHTQSMKKYFAPVAQALNEIMERDYRTKIKVGAVLFKDYVDKPVYRTIKLTSDTRRLAPF